MATTNCVPLTREKIKSILTGITGGGFTLAGARIFLGVKDLDDNDEFYNDIVDDGPALVIAPAVWGDRIISMTTVNQPFEFNIDLLLYFGYVNNLDYDYTTIEDLVSNILKALATTSNYNTAGAAMPERGISVSLDEEVNENPRIGLYTITLMCTGGDTA